jgi:hypothetical protein
MDSFTGTPGAPRGESPTNKQDRIRLTEVRKSRATEYKPNREGPGEDPANRLDRLRETNVRGVSLRFYVEKNLVASEERLMAKFHSPPFSFSRQPKQATMKFLRRHAGLIKLNTPPAATSKTRTKPTQTRRRSPLANSRTGSESLTTTPSTTLRRRSVVRKRAGRSGRSPR